VPEKVPELVVPDLEGFKLKPYVSYRTKEIYQVIRLIVIDPAIILDST
jgi:hypothetical protein